MPPRKLTPQTPGEPIQEAETTEQTAPETEQQAAQVDQAPAEATETAPAAETPADPEPQPTTTETTMPAADPATAEAVAEPVVELAPGELPDASAIDPKKITYLPNTAGCFTAEDAIRTLRLAREAGGWELVKLEVLGEAKTLYPDMYETLRATEILAKEGFKPMVYCVDDPIAAKRLEDVGAVAIMPLGAPIGSGLGIQNKVTIRLIVEGAKVPVLVDAGVGTASEAAVAMELGCDGVLMNTAIAEAKDPVLMARAMKAGVEAGRMAYRAGRMGMRRYADPSSPLAGLI